VGGWVLGGWVLGGWGGVGGWASDTCVKLLFTVFLCYAYCFFDPVCDNCIIKEIFDAHIDA